MSKLTIKLINLFQNLIYLACMSATLELCSDQINSKDIPGRRFCDKMVSWKLRLWRTDRQCCLPYLSAWNPNGSPLVPTSTPSHGFDPWNNPTKDQNLMGQGYLVYLLRAGATRTSSPAVFHESKGVVACTWFILQQADIIDISRSHDYPCQSFLGAWFQHESASRPYLRPALDEVFLTISKHSGSLEELHSQKFHDPFMGCWERLTHDRWYFGCKLSSERWPNLPPNVSDSSLCRRCSWHVQQLKGVECYNEWSKQQTKISIFNKTTTDGTTSAPLKRSRLSTCTM